MSRIYEPKRFSRGYLDIEQVAHEAGSLLKEVALIKGWLLRPLELLAGLPELGSGLEVWGELKPRTGRLVVTRVQAVALPPKRKIVALTPAAGL